MSDPGLTHKTKQSQKKKKRKEERDLGRRWESEGMERGEESRGNKCDGDVSYTCETVKEHIKIKS